MGNVWRKFSKNTFLLISDIEISDIRVPSGVYTELERANITESVLTSFNDVKLRWIGLENWTYSTEFEGKIQNLMQNISWNCSSVNFSYFYNIPHGNFLETKFILKGLSINFVN